jgi:hypothetical protein
MIWTNWDCAIHIYLSPFFLERRFYTTEQCQSSVANETGTARTARFSRKAGFPTANAEGRLRDIKDQIL